MKLGVCSVLFLIFLVLKLVKVIAWSWWWITAPLWILPLGWMFVILWISLSVVTTKKQ